ncbi:MAG: MinD/ParA family protein [Deltaproteobacteria bacterium]|nr:MinD/ParA family protein [Deltaproteobacteria bacterium]MBW1928337.1 MinD/ParA family protein [Deltaproteobacteria bacterium]MBW2025871.1 MinD/ParA family protein [Deltaproteobacteria bacterium]MBW2125055.1 MinD/ParA family protein [Deltaproteobacteria bacterium]RLB22581.1 MAG: hypothetical protein DRG76_06340 [Deltaproteobacteria bacterium]
MKICVSSGKGGVGKTSIVVNLAYCLAEKGKKVLVVDGDLGLANVDVLLGISATKTISDVMDRGADPLEALIRPSDNLAILPASSGAPDMVTLGPEEQERLGGYLDNVSSHFDVLLADTAAGIGPSVLWFNGFVDRSIVVMSSDPTSLTDAYALMKVLKTDYELERFYVIMNLVRSEEQARKAFKTVADAGKRFLSLDLEYLGWVLQDMAVPEAVRKQKPFVLTAPNAPATQCIWKLAQTILDWKQ